MSVHIFSSIFFSGKNVASLKKLRFYNKFAILDEMENEFVAKKCYFEYEMQVKVQISIITTSIFGHILNRPPYCFY